MENRGTIGIQIQGGNDTHIDNCGFSGLDIAIDVASGDRAQITRSNFRKNKVAVSIRGGAGHKLSDNIFEGKIPSRKEG